MADLRFDASRHRYFLGDRELPSVTSVLKDARLVDYSMIPRDVLQAASERGTAVHLMLQFFDEGDLDEDSLEEWMEPYLNAYKKFCIDANFTPKDIEKRVFSEVNGFAGTLDRTGVIGLNQDPAVLDFKTGLVTPGHALQLAAYTYTLPEPMRYRRIALKLSNDGTYRVHEYARADFIRQWQVFQSALTCAHWRMENGK